MPYSPIGTVHSGPPPAGGQTRGAARRRAGGRLLGPCIAIALASAVAGEFALRLFAPDITLLLRLLEETDDPRPYVLKPNARVRYEGFLSSLGRTVVWQVNARGMRDDRTYGPPSDRFRVATYGNSQAYGWSVSLEETFQRRMEAIDSRVEVLNLAVPGYNVVDSAEHLERTLPDLAPDLAIYLSTQKDLDPSLEIGTFWRKAHLLMWSRLLYEKIFEKSERKAMRRSPERKRFFADQIDRMIRFCERHGVPLIIAFTRWEMQRDLLDHLRPGSWLATHPSRRGSHGFWLALMDVDHPIDDLPEVDDHLSAPAYQEVARLLCRRVAGTEGDDRCVPPDWAAPDRGAALRLGLRAGGSDARAGRWRGPGT